MARKIRVAAAQIGAVHRTSPRAETLERMLRLLETAATQGADLVLFPETGKITYQNSPFQVASHAGQHSQPSFRAI